MASSKLRFHRQSLGQLWEQQHEACGRLSFSLAQQGGMLCVPE